MALASASAAELSTLRAITFRLSSTPTVQLPQQVPAITASLANCRLLLSSTQSSSSKASSEASVAIHRYRTFLSTLLQDRSLQGRWTAIVLIKATIEAGGWETLHKSLPWVRGLLGILTKPDPPSSKKLCIIALTRIFALTREHQTLKREITTPSLPILIQSCLQLVASNQSDDLLRVVLESFGQLLPWHPTLFRTYVKQLHQLLAMIIAPTPSSKLGREQSRVSRNCFSQETSEAARRLFAQLPNCAQKGGSNEEWEKSLRKTVSSIHKTANKVFRAVNEDWQPEQHAVPTALDQNFDHEINEVKDDVMDLTPWLGMNAGAERMIGLLRLLKEYLVIPTSSSVNLSIGLLMDLVTRVLSLTVPSINPNKDFSNNIRLNNQVSKEERDNLWALLPSIHIATIEVLLALVHRFEHTTATLDSVFLDQIVWVFSTESKNSEIRTACYLAVAVILTRSGAALSKNSIDPLVRIIRGCCEDLLPCDAGERSVKAGQLQGKMTGGVHQQASTNADAFLSSEVAKNDHFANYVGLREAARDLLPVLLTSVRAQHISHSIRALLDRTAILSQHKDAMTASILNPPPSKKFGKPASSILPLIVRSFAAEADVEALIRPRLPAIRTSAPSLDDDEEEEEDVESAVGQATDEMEEDHFVGEELDTLLETATQSENMEHRATLGASATENFTSHAHPTPIKTDRDPINDAQLAASSGSKRLQSEATSPQSPAKRPKMNMENKDVATFPTAVPMVVTVQSSDVAEVPVIAAPQTNAEPTIIASSIQEDGDSDDNDDFGELVLGQDTDEDEDI